MRNQLIGSKAVKRDKQCANAIKNRESARKTLEKMRELQELVINLSL